MKWTWLGKRWYAIVFGILFVLLGIYEVELYVNEAVGQRGAEILVFTGAAAIIGGSIQITYTMVYKYRTSKTGRIDTRD